MSMKYSLVFDLRYWASSFLYDGLIVDQPTYTPLLCILSLSHPLPRCAFKTTMVSASFMAAAAGSTTGTPNA